LTLALAGGALRVLLGALIHFSCKLGLRKIFPALGVQVHPLHPLATPMRMVDQPRSTSIIYANGRHALSIETDVCVAWCRVLAHWRILHASVHSLRLELASALVSTYDNDDGDN